MSLGPTSVSEIEVKAGFFLNGSVPVAEETDQRCGHSQASSRPILTKQVVKLYWKEISAGKFNFVLCLRSPNDSGEDMHYSILGNSVLI